MPTFIELVPCPTCDGSGDHPLNAMYQCGDCLGMGHVAVNAPARTYALPLAGIVHPVALAPYVRDEPPSRAVA